MLEGSEREPGGLPGGCCRGPEQRVAVRLMRGGVMVGSGLFKVYLGDKTCWLRIEASRVPPMIWDGNTVGSPGPWQGTEQ